jgi:hypothetical protein
VRDRSTVPLDVVPDDTAESSSLLDNMPALAGILWARQWQVYHLSKFADESLTQAQTLLGALSKRAWNGAFPREGKDRTDVLKMADVSIVLAEVLDCIDLATEQLAALNVDIRNRLEDDES